MARIINTSYELMLEVDRRASFTDNAWRNQYISAVDLALVGFYYSREPDFVTCYFCKVVLRDFVECDLAIEEHKKWSPNCPLLKRRVTTNVPINEEVLDQILPPLSYDECGTTNNRTLVTEKDIKHPNYKRIDQRMKSFETWPVGIKQRPLELSEAGFFYSGKSDETICFVCGLEIGNWEPTDNCWVEHKNKATSRCSYLELNHAENEKTCEKHDVPKNDNESDDKTELQFESFCKICLQKKSSILILPCRHVSVCGQCVFGIKTDCPICRTPIEEIISLFYA